MAILKYQSDMQKNNKSIKRIVAFTAVFIAAMIAVTVIAFPYMNRLSEPEIQQEFKAWVMSLGIWGWLVVLGIQVLQIIIAFIPGEPVEIIAGVLYGGWGGLAVCLIGCILASSGIFLLTKRFGIPLIEKLFKSKRMDEYSFLNDSRKLETVVFILFLIPGTPKDMLTYIVGTSPMKLPQFLLISTFARLPSIISSTFIGATMRQGEWEFSILIFTVTAIIGIAGIRYKDRIINFCRQMGQRIRGEKNE